MKRVYYGVAVTWHEGRARRRKRFTCLQEAERFFGKLAWKKADGEDVRKIRVRPIIKRAS